jgi:tetratricopeptide (TPR) repeat protein
MWDTLIRIKEAKRALDDGRLEEAFRLASHPSINGHRKARDVREEALSRIYARALRHKSDHNLSQAYLDVNVVLEGKERSEDAVRLARELKTAMASREEADRFHADLVERAGNLVDGGELAEAERLLGAFSEESASARALLEQVRHRKQEVDKACASARKDLKRGALDEARRRLDEARRLDGRSDLVASLGEEIVALESRKSLDEAFSLVSSSRHDEAWAVYRMAVARQPSLEGEKEAQRLRKLVKEQAIRQLQDHLDQARFESAGLPLARLAELEGDLPDLQAWVQGMLAARRAEELRREGDLESAASLFEKAASLLPRSDAARRLEKEVRGEKEALSSLEVSVVRHVIDGEGPKAVAALEKFLVGAPGCVRARELLGWVEGRLRDGNERLASASEAFARSAPHEAMEILVDLAGRQELAESLRDLASRVEARLVDAAQKVAAIERILAAGRGSRGELEDARRELEALGVVASDHPRLGLLEGRLGQAFEALGHIEKGQALERQGELLRADESYERARGLWPESGKAHLLSLRLSGQKELEEVLAAQARALAPTDGRGGPGDGGRKKVLERPMSSKDLGGSFFLRVEEGGELLVVTKDEVSIGNVLSREVDLPIMASISRLHARIERSADFHRGLTYRLVAEGNSPCSVNGRSVREATLSHGDRIGLGSDLAILFELPTEKSVSALLTLQGDFLADGVHRVLLMKPGGKDGRILLSSGSGSHVTVKGLSKEVEILSAQEGKPGVLSCVSLHGVMVDGRGGRPEEQLHDGCCVQCGEVRFTVARRV